jgi:U3 small nucleolar RNA-associated protein 18
MDSHVDTSTNRKLKRAYSQSKSSRQTRRLKQAENEEEKRLTALLFGNSFVSNPASSAWHDDDEDEYNDEENQVTDTTDDANESSFFQIDRLGYDVPVDDDDNNNEDYNGEPKDENSVDSNDDNLEEENEDEQEEIVDSAAWVDDDDRQVSVSLVSTSGRLKKLRSSLSEDVLDGNDYQQRLRERFQNSTQYTSKPDWAKIHTIPSSRIEENAPTASNILSSTIPLISSTPTYLPPNILQVIRRPDVNLSDPNQSVVQAVNFHPGSDEDTPLLFTAGLDKTLRFFRVVDDKTSEKIHGIHCTYYGYMYMHLEEASFFYRLTTAFVTYT